MVKKINKLDPENMKSSEIIDELSLDHTEEEFDELDEEFLKRYPFSYYIKTRIEEIEKRIEELTILVNNLLRHCHKGNKVLIEL